MPCTLPRSSPEDLETIAKLFQQWRFQTLHTSPVSQTIMDTNTFFHALEGGNKGDCLVAISTSGNSKNVLHAVELAKEKKSKQSVF